MSFEVDVAPRFDYRRCAHRTEVTEHGVVFATDALTLTAHLVREPEDARRAHARLDESDVQVTIDLTAGDLRGVVLESGASGPPRDIRVAECERSSTTPWPSGAPGCRGAPTAADGWRSSSARRSR